MSPSLSQALLLRKSDQALCAAVRDGNEAAFAVIVTRYRSQLLRQCRGLLRDGRAEDAVQQAFIRALQALRAGTEVRELGPWLHRIARNVALSELSARGRDHAELSEEWEDHGRVGEFERRAELRAALLAVEALPDRQRIALLRSVSGDKPAVIAEQLGLTNVALRQLLHRARLSVRAAAGAVIPPPLIWLSRRVLALCDRLPRAAGVPAGAAPVASKITLIVVASASVAAPATVIHTILAHHARPHPARHPAASRPTPVSSPSQPRFIVAAQPPPVTLVPHATEVPPAEREQHGRRAPARRALSTPTRAPSASSSAHAAVASSQPVGISASSPNSAPVGAASDSSSASGGTPVATAASASGPPPSGASGPASTASASGPTYTSSGSGSSASGP